MFMLKARSRVVDVPGVVWALTRPLFIVAVMLALLVSAGVAYAQGTPTVPTIESVAVTSGPGGDGGYAIGDEIQVGLTFSEAVTVTGAPQLTLGVGGRNRTAEYSEGSTTTQLLFTYTVASGDEDTDGIAVVANSLALNGGAIRAGSTNAALTHAALQANDHKVDGIAPTVTVGGETRTYVPPGRQFNVVFYFSEKVYGITDAEITVTNGEAHDVQATGGNDTWPKYTRWDVIIVPAAEGPVTVTLEAGAATDAYGNGNTAPDSPLEVIAATPVTVEVARTTSDFAEGGKSEFTVTRSGDNGAIPVSLSLAQTGDFLSGTVQVYPPADPDNPDEPVTPQEFTFTETPFNLNVTFAAGETSKRIAVPTEDDSRDEDDGTVTLSVPARPDQYKYIPGPASSATADVRDNDVPFEILMTSDSYTPLSPLIEGEIAKYLLVHSRISSGLTVYLEFTEGLELLDLGGAGSRGYAHVSDGRIRVELRGRYTTFSVPTLEDETIGPGGRITLVGQPGDGYLFSEDWINWTYRLSDDDSPPSVTLAAPVHVTEGDEARYTITRTSDAGQSRAELTVNVQLEQTGDYITWPTAHQPDADGLVTIPVNFAARSLTATLTLETVDDQMSEDNGSVTAAILADADGSYVKGADSGHTTRLLDNDLPVISVAAVSAEVTEGTDAQFRFNRMGNTSGATRVGLWVGGLPKIMTDATEAIALTADNADLSQRLHIHGAWVDYILEFAAGEAEKTLSFTTEADNVNEGDGWFGVTIVQRAGNPFGIGTGYAQVLVKDDDIPTVSLTRPVGPTGLTLSADGTTWEGQIGEKTEFSYSSVCTGVTEFSEDQGTNLRPLGMWVMYANHPAHYGEGRQDRLGLNFANIRGVGAQNCAGDTVTAGTNQLYVGPENGVLEIELLPVSELVARPSPPNTLHLKVFLEFIKKYEEAARTAEAAGTLITQKDIIHPRRLGFVHRSHYCAETDLRYCPKYLVGTVNKIRLTIINRDPTILIKAENSQVEEGQPARFVVERLWSKDVIGNPAPDSTTVVSLRASQNGQYITGALPTEITFGLNETRKVIELQTVGDGAFGDDGSVTIELLPDTTGDGVNLQGKYTTWEIWQGHTPEGGRSDRATVAITNDDDKPGISFAPASALEGDSGTADMTFTVTLAYAVTEAVTVNYATSDGTAIAGQDYTAVSNGSVTIAAGNTTAEFTVSMTGDETDELDETFNVTISMPEPEPNLNGGSSGEPVAAITGGDTAAAVGTILDDDPAVVTVAPKKSPVTEGEEVVFVLTRAGVTDEELYMLVDLEDPARRRLMIAKFDADAVTTELSVATENNDLVDYPSERDYTIHLYGDGYFGDRDDERYTPGDPDEATVTVQDNDALVVVTVEPVKEVVGAGESVQFRFRRTGSIAGALTISFQGFEHPSSGDATLADASVTFLADNDTVVYTNDVTSSGTVNPISRAHTVLIYGDAGRGGLHRSWIAGNPNRATVVVAVDARGPMPVTASYPSRVAAAESVSVEYTVTNLGTRALLGYENRVSDGTRISTTPDRGNCDIRDEIPAGESRTCSASFTVTNQDVTNGKIEFNATARNFRKSSTLRVYIRVAQPVEFGFTTADTLEVTEGPNVTATLPVTRTGRLDEAVTVAYQLRPQGIRPAALGEDFTDPSSTPGLLTFPANVTSANIVINITQDQIDEERERFRVVLVPLADGTITEGKESRVVRITDEHQENDPYRPTASLQLVGSGPVPESEGPVEFAIVLDREWGIDARYEVDLTFDQLTATPGIARLGKKGDFEDPGVLVVRIPAGQTRFEFSIPLYDDDVREEDETFQLLLGSSIDKSFRTIGPSNTALATIADDDRVPPTEVVLSLSHNGSALESVPEGSTQQDITVTALFPQIRWPGDAANAPLRPADPRDVDTTVRVRFDPNSGATHAAGLDDFAPLEVEDDQGAFLEIESFDIAIPAGQTSGAATLRFTPVKDDVDEEDETVTLLGSELGTVDSADSLPVRSASFTIIDDDTRGITTSPENPLLFLSLVEGGAPGTYSLVLDSQPTDTVVITLAGNQGGFLRLVPDTLTFTTSDWATPQTVSVMALDDGIAGGAGPLDIINHQVSGGDYGNVTAPDISVNITDTTKAFVYLESGQASESDGHVEFTVTVRPILRTTPVLVRYATVDGTAIAGSDYTREVETGQAYKILNIPAGQSSGIIRIPITDDEVYESADETFSLQLTNDNNQASLDGGATSLTATGAIADDDPKPVVSVAGPAGEVSYVSENAKDPVTFTLTLMGQSAGDVIVDYATGEAGLMDLFTARQGLAGATEGQDYAGASGTVTFTPGQTTKTVTVQVTDDDVNEETEFFGFRISSPRGADLRGQRSEDVADVGLLDDDPRGVAIGPASIGLDEPVAGGAAVAGEYTVKLSSSPTDTVTVTIGGGDPAVSLSGDTLTNNQLTFTTTNWNTAQTITVTPVKDDNAAGETVTLTHTVSGGDYAGIAADSVTVNLIDSDARNLVLSEESLAVTEGDATGVSYTVKLATQPSDTVTVTISGHDGADLTLSGTTLTNNQLTFTTTNWGTAQTVTVKPGDDDNTDDESETLAHTASGGDYVNITKDLPVSITDDGEVPVTFVPDTVTREVNENTGANQNVGSPVTASTGTCTLTYTLGGADAASFEIDSSTGQIKTKSGVTYDYEAKSTYTVTVTAYHADCGTATATVTINVNDVNEPPRVPLEVVAYPVPRTYDQIFVRWTPPENAGHLDITGYDIQYKLGNYGNWRNGPQNVDGTSSIISGLQHGGYYYVQVRAKNDEGSGPWSEPYFVITNVLDYEVEVSSTMVPDGLVPGDSFHLLFVTSPVQALETKVGDYSDRTWSGVFNLPGSNDLAGFWEFFRAVVSARHIDARVNTNTTYTNEDKGTPIYWVGGGKAADDYEDFYDGDWDDESATNARGGPVALPDGVWTGSTADGRGLMDGGTSRALGESMAGYGAPGSTTTGEGPIYSGSTAANTEMKPIVGLSSVFRVVNSPLVTNEGQMSDTDDRRSAMRSQAFTTGSNRYGYELSGVAVGKYYEEDTRIEASIYSVYTNGHPDTLLFEFTNLDSYTNDTQAFNAPAGATLDPGATYAIVVQHATSGADLNLYTTASDDEDDKSLDGWSIADAFHYESGRSWQAEPDGKALKIIIRGIAKVGASLAPTGLTATAVGRDRIDLSWTAPIDDGGSAITGYRIESSADGSAGWADLVANTGSAAAIYSHTGLMPNTTLHYRVSAINGEGTSDPSGAANATTADNPQVTVSFGQAAYTVLEGGTQSVTVAVTLSADPERTVVIPITHTPQDGADSPADYSGVPPSVTFNTGQMSQTITFEAIQDDVDDDGESVLLGFGMTLPPAVSLGTTTQATVSITDDDVAGVSVSEASLTIAEGSSGTYTIVLDSQPTADVTVTINDPSNTDVTAEPASLTFSSTDWNTPKTVTVNTAQDADAENDTATVTHTVTSTDSIYSGASANSVAVNVTDDEVPVTVQFGATTYEVVEGETVTVAVTLSADPERTVVIPITHTPQSGADSPADYSGMPESLTFNTGQMSQTITFTAAQDEVDDDGESVLLGFGMTLPPAVSLGTTTQATVSITDDDEAGVTLEPTTLSVVAGRSNEYTVKLATEPTGDVTVTISGHASTAVTPDNTTLTFTMGNWSMAQTVTVSATQNAATGKVTLAHTVAGADYASVTAEPVVVSVVGVAGQQQTIQVGVSSSTQTLTVPEGGANSYTLVLSSRPTGDVTVGVTLPAGTDLSLDKTTLTFTVDNWDVAQTVTVRAAADDDAVTDAGVTLTHTVSGGGYGSTTVPDVEVSITENDTAGIVISKDSLTVGEGDAAGLSYTVKLATRPSGSVSVAITGHAGTDLSLDKTTLTFTVDNWDDAQTVTVEGGEDADGANDTATLTHTASGGDYAGITVDLPVTVTDDDTAAVVLSETDLTVTEGDAAGSSYTVKLVTEPSDTVIVTISGHDGTDLTLSGTTLTFTTTNWATAQTVTVKAGQDDDGAADTATLTHTASGGDYANITVDLPVTVTDDDTAAVVLSETDLTVTEGDAAGSSYTVKLATQPSGSVSVSIMGQASTDLSLDKTTLTFTVDDWNVAQTVTVKAAHDDDGSADTATLTHTASGADYANLTKDLLVTVTDNDTPAVTIEPTALSVVTGRTNKYSVKLATKPTGDVTVTISGHASTDVTPDNTTLTFTVGNWSMAQTVTVSAAENAATGKVTLAHAVSGADYGSVSADSVVVSVVAVAGQQPTLQVGVSSSTQTLTVPEGGSNSYALVLSSRPTGDVTVGVTLPAGTDVSLDKTTLTFTTDNWDDAQTVAVTAAEDDDAVTDAGVTLTHTVSGGSYGSTTVPDVEVSITENDTAGIVISKDSLTVGEGDAAGLSYTVKLATRPSGSVSVAITGHAGTDLTLDKTSLTFTVDNWATAQTVTVKAGQDADAVNDTATLTHTASGGDYASVSNTLPVTVTDDDTAAIVLSETGVTVTEGDAAGSSYTVTLATEPTGSVSVSITGHAGTDLSLDKTTLTFTAGNWNTAQTVTVTAGQDDDGANDTATLTHTASGGDYVNVTKDLPVTVTDDDMAGVTIEPTTLSVVAGRSNEYTVALATKPTGEVTVTISGHASTDVTLDKTTLTFTVGNWSMAQTVTVSAAQSASTGKVTLTHAVSGADYGSVSADSVVVSVVGRAGQQPTLQVGVSSSAQTLTVPEGGANSYTLVLSSRPTGDVTVGVTLPTGTDLTLNKTTLTFTSTNWDTAQTVAVTAAEDDDGVTDVGVTLTHTVSGGGYGSTTVPDVEVSITENDSAGLVISRDSLTVGEGDAAGTSYTVKLVTQPSDTVIVTISGHDGTDLTLSGTTLTNNQLTFTTTNWATAQTVTIKAGQDDDAVNDTATLTHTASGGDYASVSNTLPVTVTDDDTAGVVLSETDLTVTEEDAAGSTYTVKLATQPSATVIVTISGHDGADLTLSGTTLTNNQLPFTTTNWGTAQTVTVKAGHDNDASNDTATLTHTASGGDYVNVTKDLPVSITDDEVTVTVQFGATTYEVEEGETVTVAVTLSADPERTVVIPITHTPRSGAESPADYTVPTSVTFNTGQMSQTITFTAAQDDVDDDGESVLLAFGAPLPGGVSLGTTVTTTVSITDDDGAGVSVSESSLTIAEGSSGTYTIVLDSQPTADVTVTINDPSNTDVTAEPASLTFSSTDWISPKTVTVNAAQDADADDETATVTHAVTSTDSIYSGTPANSVAISVTDDEVTVTVQFGATTYEVVEGETVTVAVTLSADPERMVVIPLTHTPQGSTTSADYSGVPANVTFSTGDMSQTITFTATQDDVDDGGKKVLLAFGTTLPGGVSLGTTTTTTVNITDDDGAGVTVSNNSLDITEGSSGTYTIVLDSQPTANVTVTINDPTDNTDATADPASLTFSSTDWNTPKTVTVDAAQDDDADDETATVTHTVTSTDSKYSGASANSVAISVTDDEVTVTVQFGATTYEVVEGETVTVAVTLSEDPERTVVIPLVATEEGGASSEDYSGVPSSVTINAGETSKTFEFMAMADDASDTGESVMIGFVTSLPSRVTEGTPNEARVTINQVSTQFSLDCSLTATVWCADLGFSDRVAENYGWLYMRYGDGWDPPSSLSDDDFRFRGVDYDVRSMELLAGTHPVMPNAWSTWQQGYSSFRIGIYWDHRWGAPSEEHYRDWVLHLDGLELPFKDALRHGSDFVWVGAEFQQVFNDWTPSTVTKIGIKEVAAADQDTNPLLPWAPMQVDAWPEGPDRLLIVWAKPASFYPGLPDPTSYTVQWKLASADWSDSAAVSQLEVAATSNFQAVIMNGMTEDAVYSVRVIASNDAGDGPPSEETLGRPQDSLPRLIARTVNRQTLNLRFSEQLDPNAVPAATNFVVKADGGLIMVDSVAISGDEVILTLHHAVTAATHSVLVRYDKPTDPSAVFLQDTNGNYANIRQHHELLEVVNITPQSSVQPLTALFTNMPSSHDGRTRFTFDIEFSEPVWIGDGLARDDMLEITGGTVISAPWKDRRTDKFIVHVRPDTQGDIVIVLPGHRACHGIVGSHGEVPDPVAGAPCAIGSRVLTNEPTVTIPGPSSPAQQVVENTPAGGEPQINGIPEVGQTLSADTTAISDADGLENAVFQYQWLAEDADISGATGATYTVVSGDVGQAIRVSVAFTDDGGHEETLTSAPTAVVTVAGLQLQSATVDGSTLTLTYSEVLDTGVTLGTTPFAVNVNWSSRSLIGVGVGESNVLLLLSSAVEVGDTVTVDYTAPDGPDFIRDIRGRKAASFSGQAVTNDTASAPLTASAHDAPSSHNGQDAFTFELRFSEEPKSDFSYTTVQDHAFTVTGGSVTYVRRLDPPSNIRWEITVTPGSGADVTIALNATTDCSAQGAICTEEGGKLSGGLLLVVPGPNAPATPNTRATGAPTISGTARVGETLTADTTGISDGDGLDNATFAYQWLADDAEINGATAATYTLAGDDAGKAVNVRVSFTDDGGNDEELTSAATGAVAPAPPPANTPATGAPTITGAAQVGETLTAGATGIADGDGLDSATFSYQWLADDAEINGATANSYTLTDAEAGKAIKVRVSFTDDAGNDEQLTSALTGAVAAAPPPPNTPATGAPTITGAAQVGETLTADTTGISDDDGLDNATFAYQWLADDAEINGANASTYTLADDDAGKTIKVRASFTDDAGNDEQLTSAVTGAVTAAVVKPPLTASAHDVPSSHNGQDAFIFELRFIEAPEPDFSYTTVRDHAFTVTGGSVTYVRRLEPGKNIRWEITVTPASSADVAIALNATTDCEADGAICTEDGRKLSGELELTVNGPE